MSLLLRAVMVSFCILFASWSFANDSAEKKPKVKKIKKTVIKYRKVQELNFSAESLDGVVRNPMGSHVTEQKVERFAPLYRVKERMEEELLDSVEFLR